MTWLITRHAGPGEHSLGGQIVVFDAEGTVRTDDPAVLAAVRAFPTAFTVTPAPGVAPGEPTAFTSAPTDTGVSPTFPTPTETSPGAPGAAPEDVPGEPPGPPTTAGTYTEAELDLLTVADLRELAVGVPGASRMTKAELVAALLAQHKG